jgi:hypothetical protein
MAKTITATKDSLWHVKSDKDPRELRFKKGDVLEIGKDVPADIAADMVCHGYAAAPVPPAPAPEEKGEEEKAAAPARKNKAGNPAKENK